MVKKIACCGLGLGQISAQQQVASPFVVQRPRLVFLGLVVLYSEVPSPEEGLIA